MPDTPVETIIESQDASALIVPAGRDVVLHTRVVTETGGGPDKTILMSAPFLADSDYWLLAAYMHPPDDVGFESIRARAKALHSPLVGVPDRGPLDGGVLRKMLNLCRRYNVTIWHGHDYKSNMIGLMLRPFHKMKLVSTVHGWVKHTTRTPLYYAVDRWALPYYHHVICVSEDLAQRIEKLGVSPDRISLIHNAIDEQMFQRTHAPAQSPLRHESHTPDGRLVLGAMGRLSAEKGFSLLITTVGELIAEGLDIELWIAGDGDQRKELEAQINASSLNDRVKLNGFVSDTVAWHAALDGFVLSSLREGLPNVVLEAMSMRTPVVATRIAGIPSMIDDGQTGLLADPGDRATLKQAIRRLVTDVQLRQSLAEQGRSLIEREYTFTTRMQRVRRIYDQVLDRSPVESEATDLSTPETAIPAPPNAR